MTSSDRPTTPSAADLQTRMLARGGGALRFSRIEKARDPRRALARLLPYLRPFRLALAAVLGLVIAYTLLGLVGPYLMGRAIDRFIAGKDPAGLARIAALMLVVFILTNLCQAVANWVMARVSQRALKSLRRDLFEHLQALAIGFFDTHPAGELMSRLTNDIDAINQAVSQNVTALLASVLSMGGSSRRCSCSTPGWRWRRSSWCRSWPGSPSSSPGTRGGASASCSGVWAS